MNRKIKFLVVMCLLLVGMMGSTAYAADLDWKTTRVDVENGALLITGYFTNNRADRIIDRINWFQPNITFTLIDGSKVTLTEKDTTPQSCYIEPGCTQEMTFTIGGPGDVWRSWTLKPKYNYHFKKIEG